MEQANRDIIPVELAVKAMRDNGYKTTAHAIAELIDNSIQARANSVELVCVEDTIQVNSREVTRINKIGVLDNGCGMSPELLWDALQFGNGSHLGDRSGIGRFGMGLPNSSISQCRSVEVWTWESGCDNAMYSYLDFNKIEEKLLTFVPKPEHKKLPEEYTTWSENLGVSGTLVLWTDFSENRLTWKRAQTIFKHTELIIGRMYRKFIDSGKVEIKLLAISDGEVEERLVRVNDPLYLMADSSTPEPFNTEAMFRPWGENGEHVFPIVLDSGKTHNVVVRASWARDETLPENKMKDRGSTSYGKHAEKNIGVSIIRAGRELELQRGWAISYDPTERWWGVEVEFPPTLDEIFGVTNNKQFATTFSQLSDFDWREEADAGESQSEYYERILDQGDPKALLLPIADYIRKQINLIREKLRGQTRGRRRSEEVAGGTTVEDDATEKFKVRHNEGHSIETDLIEPSEADREDIKSQILEDEECTEIDAERITNAIVERKLKVHFGSKHMDSYVFFSVADMPGGVTTVYFNRNHPLYSKLISQIDLEDDEEYVDDRDLRDRMNKAIYTLKLLFAAWARYEKEEMGSDDKFFEFRQEWGKMARYFLAEKNNDI